MRGGLPEKDDSQVRRNYDKVVQRMNTLFKQEMARMRGEARALAAKKTGRAELS